jgi:shikimate 5-dehydrogenase
MARDPEKARRLAREFGFAAAALPQAVCLKGDLLINATPVGMSPHTGASPLDPGRLNFQAVFDMVYNPRETRLLREARDQGIRTISGLEMFVAQASRQFELWTNAPPPDSLMREILLQHLQG